MVKVKMKEVVGFSLVEVMAAVVVSGILVMIAVLAFTGQTEKARAEMCMVNRATVEKHYELHLDVGEQDHSKMLFSEFLLKFDGFLCPEDGIFSYTSRTGSEVICSVHSETEELETGDGVPWL